MKTRLIAILLIVALVACVCTDHAGLPGAEGGDKDACIADAGDCYYCWPQGPNGTLMATCVPLVWFTCALNPQKYSCEMDNGIYECNSSKACFIATAAYGSHLHENVREFRDFRDGVLLKMPLGQYMVETYYRSSPRIAMFIEKHESAKMLTRTFLSVILMCIRHPVISTLSMVGLGYLSLSLFL